VPADLSDLGNWGCWVGTVSLLVEAALVMISVSMLLASCDAGFASALRGAAGRGRAAA